MQCVGKCCAIFVDRTPRIQRGSYTGNDGLTISAPVAELAYNKLEASVPNVPNNYADNRKHVARGLSCQVYASGAGGVRPMVVENVPCAAQKEMEHKDGKGK